MTLEFAYFYHRPYTTVIKIDENILPSSENIFMNLPTYVFDVDYVANIRSELSITVLEKKTEQNYRLKKSDLTFNFLLKFSSKFLLGYKPL